MYPLKYFINFYHVSINYSILYISSLELSLKRESMEGTKFRISPDAVVRTGYVEEGSVRSIKAMFATLHTFVISGIRHA